MKADLVARDTLRAAKIISSRVTSPVSSRPMDTMARLSPTSTMSMPAWSATCAEGKSYAVSIVIGSPFLYMDCIVCSVTFFLATAGGVPIGECEECRTWVGGDDEHHDCDRNGEDMLLMPFIEVVEDNIDRAVLLKARDMVMDSRFLLFPGSVGNELTEEAFRIGWRDRVFMELVWYKSYVEVQIPFWC